ncbi:hypothetical protein [Paraburkholderia mimosarum]|uniref:hypothetical protein n=1 Tax=Paraburkholderia mimosarum TaxID=312026 RepID=UPI003CC581D3
MFTFYRLFGWGMRQITGYMEDYWETRGLDIPVPSASQLGERFASLEVSVTQRCETAGPASRARRDDQSHRRQHGIELWAGKPVVRGKVRSEGRAHAVAQDASVDRR